MWFAEGLRAPRDPVLSAKTASDLRKRQCDGGHADPI
jgi:hypothetical protein